MISTNENLINLVDAEKVYPSGQRSLSKVSLQVKRGEFVFIAGSSGAGKSTLLKLLFAELLATGGSVSVLGEDLSLMKREKLAEFRRRIGVIFQDYKLFPLSNLIDNVSFSLEVQGVPKKIRRKLAREMLEVVGLEHKANYYPNDLSGGEQQRVAIARALLNKPELILADEPTGNLDPDLTDSIFSLLVEANKNGVTVLVASHNLRLIDEMNKRTLVLSQGNLIGDFPCTRA